jgi:hypothetical protein
MKPLTTAVIAVAVLAGCGVDKADAFRKGVPATNDVALKVPGSANGLTSVGTRRDGLEGQTAELYKTTRAVTLTVNGATAAVLNTVHRITTFQATSVTQDSATWGPHTDALSPNTWKLTVTRTAPDSYSYVLEGKAKTEPDSAYRVVLSGSHVHLGENLGTGSFLIDFNLAAQLPEHDSNTGTVQVTYARTSATAEVQIDALFNGVKDGSQTVDAEYAFRSTPGNGGHFDFELEKDFTGGSATEHGKIRSRWLETGAGRSDVQASGGDLASPMTLSECWDENFASRFFDASFSPSSNYGQASVCAFPTAEFASL